MSTKKVPRLLAKNFKAITFYVIKTYVYFSVQTLESIFPGNANKTYQVA